MTEFLGLVKELCVLRPQPGNKSIARHPHAGPAGKHESPCRLPSILPQTARSENPGRDWPFYGGIRPLAARFAASLQSIRRCGQKLLMVCLGHESGRAIPYVAVVRNRLMMKALDRVRGEGSDQWQ